MVHLLRGSGSDMVPILEFDLDTDSEEPNLDSPVDGMAK
jgi:hypothetical protein